MPQDYYDGASDTVPSEEASVAREETKENRVPESKLALVQTSFFNKPPKPGGRETVEIVDVYENEVSIKCVYDEEEEEAPTEEEPGLGMSDMSAPSGAAEPMM
jgi:hypothetical protein